MPPNNTPPAPPPPPGNGDWWTHIDAVIAQEAAAAVPFTPNTLPVFTAGMKKAKKAFSSEPMRDEDMEPLIAKEGFTFGCDPEVFIKNKEGVFVPPTGIIPGTKEEPADVGDGVCLQIDGMAAEFNIAPATTFSEFDTRVDAAIKKIKALLPKGYSIAVVPFARFDPAIFDAADEKSKELGCHPDMNAWTGEVNPPPNSELDPYLRTAAGHLHVGWTNDADLTDPQHILNCQDLVKQLDWYIGGWSIAKDPDDTRRQLYGKAGACRYKPYGVEYRVPSNFWITTRADRLMIWNRMQAAISGMSKMFLPERAGYYTSLLLESINSGRMHPSLVNDGKYPLMTLDGRQNRF